MCWKYVSFFTLKLILYNILTCGILTILIRYFPNMYIKIYCKQCGINEAEIFEIIDNDKFTHLVKAKRENFFQRYKFMRKEVYNDSMKSDNNYAFRRRRTSNFTFTNSGSKINNNARNSKSVGIGEALSLKDQAKKQLEHSFYIGDDFKNQSAETIVFFFKNSKYIYLEAQSAFSAVAFHLGKFTNMEIHEKFSDGVNEILDYNYLLNKFGENIMKLKNKTFLSIILKRIIKPLSLYQLFTIFFWMLIQEYFFYIVILFFYTILLLITSYQRYINYRKIFNESHMDEPTRLLSVKIN